MYSSTYSQYFKNKQTNKPKVRQQEYQGGGRDNKGNQALFKDQKS